MNFYSDVLTAVGSYEDGKSPYGIYDLAGNVWEWTGSDHDSKSKVLRGGSWFCDQDLLRAPFRYWQGPRYRHFDIGFRCVQDKPE